MSKTKLLPCPFCGGSAWIMGNAANPRVECHDCEIRVVGLSIPLAVEAWNRRSPDLIEALEAARIALAPFAKSGEIFGTREPDEFDMLIYSPAAGHEFSLTGDNLRDARDTLNRIDAALRRAKGGA